METETLEKQKDGESRPLEALVILFANEYRDIL